MSGSQDVYSSEQSSQGHSAQLVAKKSQLQPQQLCMPSSGHDALHSAPFGDSSTSHASCHSAKYGNLLLTTQTLRRGAHSAKNEVKGQDDLEDEEVEKKPSVNRRRTSSGASGEEADASKRDCSICGAKCDRNHLNYGAVSCYSCRAFFRR